jgi:hypothetical protein
LEEELKNVKDQLTSEFERATRVVDTLNTKNYEKNCKYKRMR